MIEEQWGGERGCAERIQGRGPIGIEAGMRGHTVLHSTVQ